MFLMILIVSLKLYMFPGDGTIRIWDVTDGRQQQIGHLKGHEGPVWKVDGVCAVSVAWDLPRLACHHVEQSAIICTYLILLDVSRHPQTECHIECHMFSTGAVMPS